jgi:small ligand-binding sensory domain FIST
MKWASAISEQVSTSAAVNAAAVDIKGILGDEAPDLLVAFASPHHSTQYDTLPALCAARFPKALLIGCSAGGVIGAGHEVEQRPALSLTAAVLPGVRIHPFHIDTDELPDPLREPENFRSLFGVTQEMDPHFLLLPEPFTSDADALVGGLDAAFPAARKLGGIASGGSHLGSNALWLGQSTYRLGAVGLALSGNLIIDTLVAQGCRPIGSPMVITACRADLLLELNGKPPMQILRALYDTLSARDQELFKRSLFLGIEMKDNQVEYYPGDFLIRNIVGMDPDSGAIGVGALLQQYQAVQFHLRDAQTATADLSERLDRYKISGADPSGALLFSCLGRGEHMFGRPDHDTELFRDRLGPVPLGGFFCNGEIGPVGGTTFLHGYTSSFGFFREKSKPS